MARYEVTRDVALKDATHPFAVVAIFRTFNRVVGRHATEAAAKRSARKLNGGPARVGVVPLERNPFYDNVQWVRS